MWRGPGYTGPSAPEPWPGRVEAFMTACALIAGRRENDVNKLAGDLQTVGDALAPAIRKLAG